MIDIPYDEIATFCLRWHVQKLALFGSARREDFGPNSDIDMLVTFEPDHVPGFFGLGAMQEELAALLGGQYPIDLVTPKFLNWRIRDRVLAEAETIYAKR